MANATNNLKLQKINGADYVDPEVFNTNYDLLDQLGVDYVTQSGSSGVWKYQRWKSGKVECWCTFSTGSNNYTTPYGGLYYPGHGFASPNFPIQYSDVPTVCPGIVSKDTPAGRGGSWICFVGETSTTNCNVNLAVNDRLEGITLRLSLYVVGNV